MAVVGIGRILRPRQGCRARLLGNATTGAKVGFFLDRHRETLMVEDRHLHVLQKMRPRQPLEMTTEN